MNNEWIDVPKKLKFAVDKKVLENKIKCWTDKIDKATETASMDDDVDVLENLRKKIKEYRKSGLEKEGELSYENLVFKFLRRSGYIQKLFDSTQKAVDKQLSIERKLEESI
jgi:hypothetical protein